MRVVLAGAHGKVGIRLGTLLARRRDEVVGIIRNPAHAADLEAVGVQPAVLDLEHADVDEVSDLLADSDAAVFSAGAGPGSGVARKDTVDRGAAVLLAAAAEQARTRRFLQVSSMGVESVRGGATPEGVDEVFVAYLRAKLAAEEDLRQRDLDWTILRPGRLTDDPGTGRVRLAPRVDRGSVSRDDVAAVLAALLDTPATAGMVLELVGGEEPIEDAVARVAREG
ncbi:SDR family oxidoreductase [Actinopolymorpha singaporensis]|uniref:Putative NADH-flavin reductase n=1 Tax=Actinopolymorpha singaporensis TaxID=117157 RepID=A0A1H1XP44_9ACTN|nr:SDR family oxidoreductase [Actinopolymorpha singaporensis]SDT10831.1 Putative NADH-flavin reductase [Actinopolymorpha singaporensis]